MAFNLSLIYPQSSPEVDRKTTVGRFFSKSHNTQVIRSTPEMLLSTAT